MPFLVQFAWQYAKNEHFPLKDNQPRAPAAAKPPPR
jgi:hypothetical protein